MNKILFLLFLPIALFAQNYLWPTNASKFLTSSFCEYRPGHYHSAIDIKTWNTEGYRIYAVEDGYIERIRISPFGYGKVLYLRLNDGRLVLYAHLQRFNKKLEKEIRKQQYTQERYSISWKPKNWLVRRGDILGYTGQTGIGVPHLHFEFRDSKGHPLNPLHFYDVIQDHIPPNLQSLLVTPMDEDSQVNGSFDQQQFNLRKHRDHVYKINTPIRASGKIGLALQSYDKADKIYNRFAAYRTTLEVNGKQVFQIQYDTLDFDLTGQIEIDIDYPVYKQTKRRYNKLYIEPFNELLFYKRELGNGILEVKSDTIQFKIDVFDFDGNKSTLLGTLIPDPSEAIKITSLQRKQDRVLIALKAPKKLQNLQLLYLVNKNWKNIDYYEIMDHQINASDQTLVCNIQLADSNIRALKIKSVLSNGQIGEKQINCPAQDSTPVQLSITNRGKYLHLKTNPLKSFLNLSIQSQNKSGQLDHRLCLQPEAVIPARDLKGSSFQFHMQRNGYTLLDTSIKYYVLNPGEKQDYFFFNGRYHLQSSENSVYDTLLFQVHEKIVTTDSFSAPVLSNLFRINGQRQVLKGPLQLSVKYDSLTFPTQQVGLGRRSAKGKLSWKKTKWDSLGQTFAARIGGPGHYLLVADTSAPVVEIQQPQTNQILKSLKAIQFTMDDSLSGIGTDRNIEIRLDGHWILPEWDPERNLVTGKPDQNLTQGDHVVVIQVSDVAGNVFKDTIPFRILK